MKNAANCAKHGELQGFMKPLLVERILRPLLTGMGHAHLRVEEKTFVREDALAVRQRLFTGLAGSGGDGLCRVSCCFGVVARGVCIPECPPAHAWSLG